MIISQAESDLNVISHRSNSYPQSVLEVPTSLEEDDIHICGTCRRHFTDIFLFMRHKSEGNCSSRQNKSIVSVTVPSNVPSTGNPHIFTSLSTSGTEIRCSVPQTRYTRVTIQNTEELDLTKKSSVVCAPSTEHSDSVLLSSEQNDGLLCDVANQSLDLRKQESGAKSVGNSPVELSEEWNSQWISNKHYGTIAVSGTHPVSVCKKVRCKILSPEKHYQRTPSPSKQTYRYHVHEGHEESNDHNCHNQLVGDQSVILPAHHIHEQDDSNHTHPERAQDNLKHDHLIGQQQQSQVLERPLRHNSFLDVEDVEVATLLANHLTNDPSLPMYSVSSAPSESLLVYGNVPSHLADSLNFGTEVSVDERQEQTSEIECKKRQGLDVETLPCAKKIKINDRKILTSATRTPEKKQQVECGACPVPKHRKLYACDVEKCSFQGSSSRDLTRHMRKHSGERPFKCQQCGKDFSRADKLTAHRRIHAGTKSYKCEVCDYACVEHHGLVRHMRIHNNERPYKCQICEYSARTMSHLTVHTRTHTGDNPYVCDCGKAFKTSSDLKRHMKIHVGDKPFACPHCSYCSTLKTNLQTHIRLNHSTDQTFSCLKCDVVCHSKRDLKAHEKTHAEELLHCSHCDYICVTKSALKNHMKVHSPNKEKPFACKQCPFTTNKRGNYRVHVKRKHTSKKSKFNFKGNQDPPEEFPDLFHCPYCSSSFWREGSYNLHLRQHQLEESSHLSDLHPTALNQRPTSQDPVLADSADSRDSADADADADADSASIDSTSGLASLATLASYHTAAEQSSSEQQPAFLYKYISGSQTSDNIRNAEILASLNQNGGTLPQYVTIQQDQSTLVEALNGMQYVLSSSPLGTLDDNDNAAPLLS